MVVRRLRAALGAGLLLVAVPVVTAPSSGAATSTTRVSLTSTGAQEKGGAADAPAMSADGRYVAFASTATNVVPGDTNVLTDIFVRDTVANTTVRVSVASDGTQSNGVSDTPVISGDGHFVAFHSLATNLVAGDTNGVDDIFLHDMQTGATTRISISTGGTQGDALSNQPSISGDGHFVAFRSMADNLIGADLLAKPDIFVRDTVANTTERVSLSASNGSPRRP